MTMRICMRMDTGSSDGQSVQSILGGVHPCSLRPPPRETSADATPFLKALFTHRISRSCPPPPNLQPILSCPAVAPAAAGPAPDALSFASTWPLDPTPHAYAALCVGALPVSRCPPPAHAGRAGILCKRPADGHAVATTPIAGRHCSWPTARTRRPSIESVVYWYSI